MLGPAEAAAGESLLCMDAIVAVRAIILSMAHSTIPVTPPNRPQIRLYQDWLRDHRGLQFGSYDELWRWSVSDLDSFWQSIWDYFDMHSPTPRSAVLREPKQPDGQSRMIDAKWFDGATVNYAEQIFRHVNAADKAGCLAIISHNEKTLGKTGPREITWPQLRQQVASLALHLQAMGVKPGDRVAGYLPNIPETMIAFIATVSVGGVWSVCAPDMGTQAVLDRFKQIEPKVLFAVDGVTYGGKDIDRREVVQELCANLPTVTHLVLHNQLGLNQDAIKSEAASALFARLTARNDSQTQAFEPIWLPFDHPLWIVYSSGTTGLPKPIVHGHGGTTIVALMGQGLHNELGASYSDNNRGEKFHWYSSTGWVMWNAQTNGLLFGATCCIFDGNPAGRSVDDAGNKLAPDWSTLYRFAAEVGVTFFGAGAAFFANCMKAGLDLSQYPGLKTVRALGTTGSPLSADVQSWGSEQFAKVGNQKNIWWANISGGTDFAGAFIGGNRELPLIPGEMQCRILGCAVEAWDEQGEPVIGEVGELVCTRPIPSMPLYFWNDEGNKRYLSSYFDMYPGKNGLSAPWRHGDWLKINPIAGDAGGGCIIYGRSDATINRYGLRMGTSELYSAVEALPEVLDSMVVDLEYLGRESYMPLFVVLREGVPLDDVMRGKLNNAIKVALSPRFVPNEIFQVNEIPRTLSGKKQELPIKKLMLGQPLEKVINKEAMANPGCLDWYVAMARAHTERARVAL
jgi:acetoacetyl-CoA synthetase